MADPSQLILVVEDSDEHFEAVRRAFARTGIRNPLRRCADGDEALDYLFRRGGHNADPAWVRPAVVLLDLNLPGTDGREVLDQLKADPGLKSLPVVVVSTSSNPTDVEQSYRTGASGYIVKPVRFDDFLTAVENLKSYWFDTVALPKE